MVDSTANAYNYSLFSLLSKELLRTGDGASGVPREMGGVADMQVCFGARLIQNCDH